MNITAKSIIVDTNIISDLCNSSLIDNFILLDNVYISDMVLNDEINSYTGNVETISKIRTLELSNDQLIEVYQINEIYKTLSIYDCVNYVLARDNNGILATGDKRLLNLAKNNNVEIIRTLKIIEEMYINNYINKKQMINGLELLKNNERTRIPIRDIDQLIDKYIN